MRKSWQQPSRTRNCSQTRRNLQIRVCSGYVPGYVPDSVVFCYFHGCARHPTTAPTYNTCCSALAPPEMALLILPGRLRNLPCPATNAFLTRATPRTVKPAKQEQLCGTGKGFAPAKLANCPWCVLAPSFPAQRQGTSAATQPFFLGATVRNQNTTTSLM